MEICNQHQSEFVVVKEAELERDRVVYDGVFGRFGGLELVANVLLPLPGIPTSRSMNSCAAGCGLALLLLVADDDDERTELLVVGVVVVHVFLDR